MTDRYAVIGNPVSHSKSPLIHAAFARATGQDIAYEAIFAPHDAFETLVGRFAANGGRGLNVTLPFKHRAYALAAERSARAEAAGAVNTLSFEGGRVLGDNTDGIGLVRDLTLNHRCALRGRRVLLLGAGGASYGVCAQLLAEAPAELAVANRTEAKAVSLCERFSAHDTGGVLRACGFAALTGRAYDVVINATSAGLTDEMPGIPESVFGAGALAYDMVYGRVTPFMGFAAARGATVADGLGMLVEQAAESFFVWRGIRPDTAPVIARLRG